MRREIINPPGLVPPRGFNHGVLTSGGRLLFLAGQDATGVDTRIVAPGDLVAQFAQALSNLTTVVEAAGGRAEHVVRLTIYVKSHDDYVAKLKPLGEVYRQFFGGHYPAMALFEVSGFFQPDALVEIEGIAVLDEA